MQDSTRSNISLYSNVLLLLAFFVCFFYWKWMLQRFVLSVFTFFIRRWIFDFFLYPTIKLTTFLILRILFGYILIYFRCFSFSLFFILLLLIHRSTAIHALLYVWCVLFFLILTHCIRKVLTVSRAAGLFFLLLFTRYSFFPGYFIVKHYTIIVFVFFLLFKSSHLHLSIAQYITLIDYMDHHSFILHEYHMLVSIKCIKLSNSFCGMLFYFVMLFEQ